MLIKKKILCIVFLLPFPYIIIYNIVHVKYLSVRIYIYIIYYNSLYILFIYHVSKYIIKIIPVGCIEQ